MNPDTPSKLIAGLNKIALVLRHQAWASATDASISPTQGQTLSLLAARAPVGLRVSDIAAQLAVTQPTISDAVKALERKGLVAKARAEHDARVTLVTLTPAGAKAADAAAQWPDVLLRAAGALTPDEQAVFTRSLVKMIHSLQDDGQIPTARMCATCAYFRPHAHNDARKPHHCAYIDAPLAEADLQIDCNEHDAAPPETRERLWQLYLEGAPM